MRTLVIAIVMAVCLMGCQRLISNKAAGATILNVNDLNAEHKKDKEALRAKYEGKEVIVMGRATQNFNPDDVFFEMGEKKINFPLQADLSQETWVGVDCMVEAANKNKFVGLKKDDVFAVKGIFHVTQGGMEVAPCSRELRDTK